MFGGGAGIGDFVVGERIIGRSFGSSLDYPITIMIISIAGRDTGFGGFC